MVNKEETRKMEKKDGGVTEENKAMKEDDGGVTEENEVTV